MFMPMASGTFVISDNHSAGDGGYSFDLEKSVNAYDRSCDIYLYATESKVGLSSPNRLTPGMRKSRFSKDSDNNEASETITISSGDNVIVKTRSGRAVLKINDIKRNSAGVSAQISYSYVPSVDGSDK
jgi:hypothetical protein